MKLVMRIRRRSLPMKLVIKMVVIASPVDAESRSETGTNDSNGLISKSRGTKSAVWICCKPIANLTSL